MQLHTVLMMAEWQVKGLQLFAALSILIILHEFGHFFFAKLFKTRVEKFYLFFDFLFPFSGLLNFSLFKKKVGGTEYGLGWFPLGGYVKIAGMVDESMDTDQLSKEPEPWEYRSKPAWQRLFIMLGGIIMNVLTAMVIYTIIFGIWGETYLPTKNVKYGIVADSLAQSIGLQNGDKILTVDNKEVERFNRIPLEIVFNEAKTIQVDRNGTRAEVNIPSGTIGKLLKSEKSSFIRPRIPAVVGGLMKGSNAEKAGFKENDSIIAINNSPVFFTDEVEAAKKQYYGQEIAVSVVRGGQVQNINVKVPASKDSLIGIGYAEPARFLTPDVTKYSMFGAIGKGFTYTFEQFGFYWQQFKLLFTSKEVKVNENLGGIASFGKIFPSVFDWHDFLALTAFVSIILAFMNLLPIPGLDGGYVIFLLFELITRRKVSDKVMERATTVGLVLLLALMVYANGLDIFRLIKK
ncbi:RIP metalloprotease RseP [Chitinophagaceae bacterium MMS25-I14]